MKNCFEKYKKVYINKAMCRKVKKDLNPEPLDCIIKRECWQSLNETGILILVPIDPNDNSPHNQALTLLSLASGNICGMSKENR